MALYTAQYRYPGQDRLDITVKGNNIAGKLYAPTWDMVKGLKNHLITEDAYTVGYYELLQDRWKKDWLDFRASTIRLVQMVSGGGINNMPKRDLTLVCFCPKDTFCHRYLLVNWLTHNWPQTPYGGERMF